MILKKHFQKGFTLLELLVVIAIIGVLAAVILTSLNSARSKGEDAAIKSNIKTITTQAQLYADSNNDLWSSTTSWGGTNTTTCTFPNTFLADSVISKAITAILNGNSGSRYCYLLTNGAPGYIYAWVLVFPLKQTANTFWCIDSTGASREKNLNGVAYNGTSSGTFPAVNTGVTPQVCR